MPNYKVTITFTAIIDATLEDIEAKNEEEAKESALKELEMEDHIHPDNLVDCWVKEFDGYIAVEEEKGNGS